MCKEGSTVYRLRDHDHEPKEHLRGRLCLGSVQCTHFVCFALSKQRKANQFVLVKHKRFPFEVAYGSNSISYEANSEMSALINILYLSV